MGIASMSPALGYVGAGGSQVRYQAASQAGQLTDQKPLTQSARPAALMLIQTALTGPLGATGHDLDVMA